MMSRLRPSQTLRMLRSLFLGLTLLALAGAVERDDAIVGYEEMDRTFIVIGATGAGKSTFINSMVYSDTNRMPKNFRASPKSQTTEVAQRSTPRYRMNIERTKETSTCSFSDMTSCITPATSTVPVGIKVTFFDTIGVDAEDMKGHEGHVFRTLVKAVASEKVHGFLLIHKMERFRKSFHEELKTYLRMLKELGISTNKILLAITHGGQYSDEVKEQYTTELCAMLTWFPNCTTRTMHANFVNLEEMHPDFKDFYTKQWPVEFNKVIQKVSEYNQPFYPLANIVEKAGGFDNVLRKVENSWWYDTASQVNQAINPWGTKEEDIMG